MICFAFLNPQSIRLLLDRAKYDGVVLPSVTDRTARTVSMYSDALAVTRKQTIVFIHQDLPSLIAVLRSGKYEPNIGKHILCASISTLAGHDLEAIDTVGKLTQDADWRVRSAVIGPLGLALTKDVGLDDDTIARLVRSPVYEEHKFSNPIAKVEVEKPCVDLREIAGMLPENGTQNREIMVALLRYVSWSFVSAQASALGTTHNEINRSASTKLIAANSKLFSQYVSTNKLQIHASVISRVRTMFTTSVPASLIMYAHRRLQCKRAQSLAVLESGCSTFNADLIDRSGLSASDFPSLVRAVATPVVATSNLSCVIRIVAAGVYSFTTLLNLVGERAEHAFDVVRRAKSKIKFSRNPVWHENDNCWKIADGSDLYMLYNDVKYRFCTPEAVAPPKPLNHVTATSPVVKVAAVRKKTNPEALSSSVPEHMRVKPLSPGRVVAVKVKHVEETAVAVPRRLSQTDIARIVNERKPVAKVKPSKPSKPVKEVVVLPPVKPAKATKAVALPAKKAVTPVKAKAQSNSPQKKHQVTPVRGSSTPSKKATAQPVHRKRSR